MAFSNIPIRTNDIDELIDASWFNTIRSELIAAFGSGGYIAVEPAQLLDNNDELTYSTSSFKPLLQVAGNGIPVTLSDTPFGNSHGFVNGKEIIIIGLSDTNTVTIPENDSPDGVVNAGGGDIVLSKYSYVLLIYNQTLGRFIATTSGGQGGVGVHEFAGVGDGVTTSFGVTALPLTDESLIVYRNGLLVPKSEWTYTAPNVVFNTAPALAQRVDVWVLTSGQSALSPVAGVLNVEYPQVSAANIISEGLALSNTPLEPSKVLLDVIGGSSQIYGIDFTIIGSNLNWSGLGLSSVIAEDDYLRVTYYS